MEIWKPIPTYEDRYEVSNRGRVRQITGKVMTIQADRAGYHYLKLSGPKNQTRHFKVHCLVLWAFERKIPQGLETNHINGDKSDNRWPENLEIVTRSHNQLHCTYVLGRKPNLGSRHGMSKLTESQVLEIRSRKNEGLETLAKAFAVSAPTISMILNRRTWTHI